MVFTFIDSIPQELFYIIFHFLEFSKEEIMRIHIKNTIHNFNSISLINKTFNKYLDSYKLNLNDLKHINYLIKKYNVIINDYEYDIEYNKLYKSINKYKKYDSKYEMKGFPLLIDIVSSGITYLPLLKKSLDYFNDEILNDIELCLKYFPSSVNSNYGRLRCRLLIGPLYFACLNENIPLTIIKLLIHKGVSINETLLLNGYNIKALDDLNDKSLLKKERYDSILNILI